MAAPTKVLVKVYEPPPPSPLEDPPPSDGRVRFQIDAIGGLGAHYEAFKRARAGARFEPNKKIWIAEPEVASRIVSRLEVAGFAVVLPKEVRAALAHEVAIVERSVAAAEATLARLDEVLAAKGRALFDYQRQDVLWLSSRKRAINCSEMGLGKSAVALAALPPAGEVGVVVGCPKIAKGVWRNETAKWREEFRVTTLAGRGSFRWPAIGEMVVINYEIIPPLKDLPKPPSHPISLIGDEAHLLRNHRSQRSIRFARLAEIADRVLLLTGTPLPSEPSQLWSLMLLCGVAHEAFGTYKEFMRVFNGEKDFFGSVTWGSPLPESGEYLERVLIRHLKDDVLDLPPKLYGTIEVDIDPTIARLLDKDPDAETILKAKSYADVPFNKISTLRKILATAKTEAALELAETYEENETPVVFFSWHRGPVDALGARPGWVAITGDTSDKDRARIAADFQAGKLKGVAATIQTAGTALTLTRAKNVVFVDLSYVPGDNQQAEDRCHRIGTDDKVTILHMVCDHAIDKRLRDLIAKKQGIIDGSVNTLAARRNKDTSSRALIPGLPPKVLPTVGGANRRAAKNTAEARGLEVVYLVAGLRGECPAKVLQSHLRTALDMGTEAMGSEDTLTDAQWRNVLWLEKQYSSKIKAALATRSSKP